jgi:hypothetical protein
MKIKVDIECSPQEARAFFGLPDVTPLQEAVTDAMQSRLKAVLEGSDGEALLRAWLPMGQQGLEALQKFWSLAASGGRGDGKPKA